MLIVAAFSIYMSYSIPYKRSVLEARLCPASNR
jgi:hypothetical protein